MMEVSSEKSLEVFFCYAHQNEDMRNQLEKHLRIMQRQGLISAWHDSKVDAGKEWEPEANDHLNKAHIILLLVSPDFMNSDYCYSTQMKRALDRYEKKEALVIPILLRPVDLEDAPFKHLKALPTNGKFVTRWRSRDDAFTDIARGIRSAIKTFLKTSATESGKASSKKIKKTFYCDNCKAPVSLPMPCWKCGFPPMQICVQCFEKNLLDRESCQRCESSLALVCNHCKAKNSFEAEFCGNCGFQLQLICYECGERNLPDQEACQKCGASLIQACSHCVQTNALEAEICQRCGMPLVQICTTCDAFNGMDDDTCWRCNEPLDIEYELEIPLHLVKVFS